MEGDFFDGALWRGAKHDGLVAPSWVGRWKEVDGLTSFFFETQHTPNQPTFTMVPKHRLASKHLHPAHETACIDQ